MKVSEYFEPVEVLRVGESEYKPEYEPATGILRRFLLKVAILLIGFMIGAYIGLRVIVNLI